MEDSERILTAYGEMTAEEHRKKKEKFNRQMDEYRQYCQQMEWMMHGAGKPISDEIMYDEEEMRALTDELASYVEDIEKKGNRMVKGKTKEFASHFFRMSLSYLYLTCLEEDLNYASFIMIANALDKGANGELISTFEIMVEQAKEELKEVFFEDYDVMMQLHQECFHEQFAEVVQEAVYHYLDAHELELTYENQKLQDYILRSMKNTVRNIRDFSMILEEEERNRELYD